MPWHIGDHADCSGFAVIKDTDGSVSGCHETRAEAEAQMRALYASENGDEMTEDRAEYQTGSTGIVASEREQWLEFWTRLNEFQDALKAEIFGRYQGVEEAQLSETAHAVALEEQVGAGPRDPLKLTFRLIKPGFGNSADGHYYSADVLKAAAPLFQGAKMYASDHRPEERSVLTEVAVIDKVIRFDTDGAPIALATIFDPTFAESTRNRAKAGLLGTLECSILGQGKAKQGKVGERDANIVESITAIHSVDLVSRAGAGGRALEIAESDSGGENVTEKETKIEEVADEAKTVTLREDENDAETEQPTEPTAQDDTEPEATTEDEPEAEDKEEEETDEQPVLSAESVTGLLAESGLGTDAINLLAARPYQTEQDVTAAIGEMTAMIKRLTGSGQPFAQGNTAPTAATPRTPQQEVESYRAIKEKWGLRFDYKVEG